jgi:hypothetical protein
VLNINNNALKNLLNAKTAKRDFLKLIFLKATTIKAPTGLHDIIFVYSRHVEAVIMMTYCGLDKKRRG